MGCDIHIHTEILRNVHGTETWVNGDFYKINPDYSHSEGEEKYDKVSVFRGRDYRFFSILADVRSDGNNPYISKPKGLPNDVTVNVKEAAEFWGLDGHSHSYLNLDELKCYIEKYPTVECEGLISQDQADKLDQGVSPNSWCDWTSDESYVRRKWNIPNHSLENLISALEDRGNEMYVYDPKKIRIVLWFDN